MTKRDLELEVARLRGQVEVLTEELRRAQGQSAPVVQPQVIPYWPQPGYPTTPYPWDYQPTITWCKEGSSTGTSITMTVPQ